MTEYVMSEISALELRVAAMNLLAFREHTIQELVDKLSRRFIRKNRRDDFSGDEQSGDEFSGDELSQEIDAVREKIVEQVDILASENLQSDQRFCESFVRSRVAKGQGPIRIKRDLSARGVAANITAAVIENAAVDWFAVLAELSIRKYGETKPVDVKETAKRQRFFQYRGFSYDQINSLDLFG